MSGEQKTSSKPVTALLCGISLGFVVLKLCGVAPFASASWLWVAAPFAAYFVLVAVFILACWTWVFLLEVMPWRK